jgi:hypothetical protein
MDDRKRRVNTSAAIVVAALIISATVFLSLSPYGFGPPRTATEMVTTTATSITTTTETASTSSIQLHEVTFNESALCDGYADEWAVTLGISP